MVYQIVFAGNPLMKLVSQIGPGQGLHIFTTSEPCLLATFLPLCQNDMELKINSFEGAQSEISTTLFVDLAEFCGSTVIFDNLGKQKI